MYPNDQFNSQPTGIDYLNQIATPPPAIGFDFKTKVIIAVLAVIGLLSIILIIAGSQSTTAGPSLNTIAARLQKLQHITTTYKPKLKAIATQEVNSSLNAILTSANNAISDPAARSGLDIKKQAEELAVLDPPNTITNKLDEAFLNADLDAVYTYTMNTELADTILMMERLQKSTKDTELQKALAKIIADFTTLRKQLTVTTTAS